MAIRPNFDVPTGATASLGDMQWFDGDYWQNRAMGLTSQYGFGRAYDVVVAANDSSTIAKAQADFVCAGSGLDDVTILAALAAATHTVGNAYRSIKFMPGDYQFTGRTLDIPALQNFSIDARGSLFFGHVRMDSAMDCWMFLPLIVYGLEIYPRNNVPVDAQVVFTTNQIWTEDILTTGANGYCVKLNGASGSINRNTFFFSGLNGNSPTGADQGLWIPDSVSGINGNKFECGFSQAVATVIKVGTTTGGNVYDNEYTVRSLGTSTSGIGVDCYGTREMFYLRGPFSGMAANSAVVFRAPAIDCHVFTNTGIDTFGWQDLSNTQDCFVHGSMPWR